MARRTPPEKKALQYKKERRTGSLHGYVKSYPDTKARINRAYRHEANATLRTVSIESLETAVEVTDEQAITRERLQQSIKRAPGGDFKAYPHTLNEWVKARVDGRVQRAGDRYFSETYSSAVHRKRFKRYLQTLLSGRSSGSAKVASYYKELLDPPNPDAERYHADRRTWLRSFFRDEPDCELELKAWIVKMGHQ
jgi:transcriptional accessory protein Tex/SPT6